MARIRYLKPEFFTDEDLADLPFEARLLFAGLWCHADKAGRLEDRPKYLKAMIFPYDPQVDLDRLLGLLINKPFINRYKTEDGRCYISIPSWTKHQSPHHTEKDSSIPPPENPPHTPLKDKDKDKDKEKCSSSKLELTNGSVTVKKINSNKNKYSDDFLTFWNAYPVKVGKDRSWDYWKKRNGDRPPIEHILNAIKDQIDWRCSSNGEFRPEWKNPCTWINQGCWNDEVSVKKEITGEDIDRWTEQHSKT
jgi:hypothetical protein